MTPTRIHAPRWWARLCASGAPAHQALAGMALDWITRTRARRRILVPALLLQLLTMITIAAAPQAAASFAVSAVGWTGITDSEGVPVASYMFATDHGTILNPLGNSTLANILQIEAGIFIAIVVLGIWFVGWALDFGWLNILAPLMQTVSDAISVFSGSPVIALTATIGVGVIALTWQFGRHSKAASQLLMLILVAVGSVTLVHSVTWLASEDGPLTMGRDVGLSIAAEIDGSTAVDGKADVTILQAKLADSLARRPLQLWNFGVVADDQGPACRDAWSAGTADGDEDAVKDGIAGCGAAASEQMKQAADNPSGGQVATGLAVIILGVVVLGFLAYASGKVIKAAVQAMFYAMLSAPAFAFAFMLGGSFAFAARVTADAIISALAMGAYVIFLAGSMLIIDGLVTSDAALDAGPIGSLFITTIIMVVLAVMLAKLSGHLELDSTRITQALSSRASVSSAPPQAPDTFNRIEQDTFTRASQATHMALHSASALSPRRRSSQQLAAGKPGADPARDHDEAAEHTDDGSATVAERAQHLPHRHDDPDSDERRGHHAREFAALLHAGEDIAAPEVRAAVKAGQIATGAARMGERIAHHARPSDPAAPPADTARRSGEGAAPDGAPSPPRPWTPPVPQPHASDQEVPLPPEARDPVPQPPAPSAPVAGSPPDTGSEEPAPHRAALAPGDLSGPGPAPGDATEQSSPAPAPASALAAAAPPRPDPAAASPPADPGPEQQGTTPASPWSTRDTPDTPAVPRFRVPGISTYSEWSDTTPWSSQPHDGPASPPAPAAPPAAPGDDAR